jgi:hypothetical protein
MAKVIIYEDSLQGMIWKYEGLGASQHDVHVRSVGPDLISPNCESALSGIGFSPSQVREFDGEIEEADVYFVDGLYGDFFSIMSKLPREKAFLNSRNPQNTEAAKRMGYKVLEEMSPEEAIEKVLAGTD